LSLEARVIINEDWVRRTENRVITTALSCQEVIVDQVYARIARLDYEYIPFINHP
jgi:hypothetical protein